MVSATASIPISCPGEEEEGEKCYCALKRRTYDKNLVMAYFELTKTWCYTLPGWEKKFFSHISSCSSLTMNCSLNKSLSPSLIHISLSPCLFKILLIPKSYLHSSFHLLTYAQKCLRKARCGRANITTSFMPWVSCTSTTDFKTHRWWQQGQRSGQAPPAPPFGRPHSWAPPLSSASSTPGYQSTPAGTERQWE